MEQFPRHDLAVSAVASLLLSNLGIGWAFGSPSQANLADWLFVSVTMTISGCVTFFNVWMLSSGRKLKAIRCAYPNDGDEPERLLGAGSTTFGTATYWTFGIAATFYYRLG